MMTMASSASIIHKILEDATQFRMQDKPAVKYQEVDCSRGIVRKRRMVVRKTILIMPRMLMPTRNHLQSTCIHSIPLQ